jgi:hypothetical protein
MEVQGPAAEGAVCWPSPSGREQSQLNSEIERLATSALALGQLQVKYARIREIYECNS